MIGLDELDRLMFLNEEAHARLQVLADRPAQGLDRRFSLEEGSGLVGVSIATIQNHREGMIASGELNDFDDQEKGRRQKGYTLEQVNQLRQRFGTQKRRRKSDDCMRISVQHLKGGVGKSSTAVGLSQFLATQGYRVLLIDMDFQGSATCSFGYVPDKDIENEHTLIPYYQNREQTLQYCIRQTAWEGLDLIPCCLKLHNLEFEMFGDVNRAGDTGSIEFLNDGLETIEHNYDMIIMDSPPHAGLVALSILYAANAIVIPSPPSLYDFTSTKQFLNIATEQMQSMPNKADYHFVKLLATKVKEDQTAHRNFLALMKLTLNNNMYDNHFLHTAALENAAVNLGTVYEARRPANC